MSDRLISILKMEYDEILAAEERAKQERIDAHLQAWREETMNLWRLHGEKKFQDVTGLTSWTMIPEPEPNCYKRGTISAEGLTFMWEWFASTVRIFVVDNTMKLHQVQRRRQLAYLAHAGRLG